MALQTKPPRDKALTIRISKKTHDDLVALGDRHNLSMADVVEALVEHETNEGKRLKGKTARYQRNKHAKKA